MTQTLTHFINGASVEGTSGRFADVYHPAKGEVAAKLPLAAVSEGNNAVAIAAKAQIEWPALHAERRARIRGRFVDLCHDDMDELAKARSNGHGKTSAYAKCDALRDTERV